MKDNSKFRLIILGAGFSKPAGLPLGNQLFLTILSEAKKVNLSHILEPDIYNYIRLKSAMEGKKVRKNEIDLESFISYLDIEHFLLLQGSDTWSTEGNRSQILIRNLLCKVLFERQLNMPQKIRQLYENFVSHLRPNDLIISLNYDTLLEENLIKKNVPFRFSQQSYLSSDYSGSTVNTETNEVILLKMHGSLNWFDVSKYNQQAEYFQQGQHFQNPTHPVFGHHSDFFPKKIVDPNYHPSSPLSKIYYISDIQKYIKHCDYVVNAPLIISPSYAKMVYLNPLREFWYGFNDAGYMNPEMIIIGFSFSQHDEYLLIPIVRLITNFQKHNQSKQLGYKTSNLKIIDFKTSNTEIDKFKARLPFIDWQKTDTYWKGFSLDVINHIFSK